MAIIAKFLGIIVKIHFQDHPPPHFHAEYQGYEAVYNIQTGEKIEGVLPHKQNKIIIKWARQKQQKLLENWELVQNRKRPIQIKGIEK